MSKDGLWAQMERGANKIAITDGNIRKAFEGLAESVPQKKERRISVITGSAGAQAIRDAISSSHEAHQHRIEIINLIYKLDQMLANSKITKDRHEKLSHLACSDDMRNFEMAKKITEYYT